MKQYLDVMSQYATLRGRAARDEYWVFFLVNILIQLACLALTAASGIGIFLLLAALYSLATLLPGIAVTTRRLHDTGRSGFAVLWTLVPVLGAVMLIYFLTQPGDEDTNEYGPVPR